MPSTHQTDSGNAAGSQTDINRRLRRRALGVAGFIFLSGLAFFSICFGAGVRQADPAAIAFSSRSNVDKDMAVGETLIVYMDSSLSGALAFDFYPSNFACSASLDGRSVPMAERDERRRVNAAGTSWSIASVTAADAGKYQISCPDQTNRDLPLLLARPGPTAETWLDPGFGAFVVILTTLVSAITAIVALIVTRGSRNGAGNRLARGAN